ncbi:MAG: hypothetical protein H8M99_15450 [Gloeobacteraceae cyanobacterium ES-bin-144]|nr:hypothetical protein [Verrucomicrobiales bacterium]
MKAIPAITKTSVRAPVAPELFAGKEMGEDALRVLGQYLKFFSRIQADMSAEIPLLREAARWGGRLNS